jgi:hypothetical protein
MRMIELMKGGEKIILAHIKIVLTKEFFDLLDIRELEELFHESKTNDV